MASDASKFGQAACLALVNIGTKPALETAASIFLHGEEALRRVISEAFAHHIVDGHPILKEASSMEDLLLRRTSIHGLRLVNEPWAIRILDEMQIEDGQWVVRNAAAQAMDFRARGRTRDTEGGLSLRPGKGTGAAYDIVREQVPFLEDDRPMVYDIENITKQIQSGEIVDAVEAKVGEISLEFE